MSTTSEKVQQRLLDGEALSPGEVAKQYGCTTSMLTHVRNLMQKDGYRFQSKKRANNRTVDWSLVSRGIDLVEEPDHAPPVNGQLPALGQQVAVTLLAVTPDGGVKIGLRSGGQTWLVQLVGETRVGDLA